MILRLRQGTAPPPPATCRIRLHIEQDMQPGIHHAFLRGMVEDDTLLPFEEVNAQVCVAGGMMFTPPRIQNKFEFRVRWELGRMIRDLVAILYYMPSQQQVIAATVVANKPL